MTTLRDSRIRHLVVFTLRHKEGSPEAEGIHHLGFDRDGLVELGRNAGFVDVEARPAIDIEDEGRHYPAFLLVGRNP